ncbi:MAG: DUF5752 family protein [Candidatus Bathyarchaeaceae archaeon]
MLKRARERRKKKGEEEKLPQERAFYFFTSVGNYTGESAASLEEFIKITGKVDIKSLEFHLYRGDFEKWIAETLGDKGLAEAIKNLHDQKLVGENLRNQLHLIVSKRL